MAVGIRKVADNNNNNNHTDSDSRSRSSSVGSSEPTLPNREDSEVREAREAQETREDSLVSSTSSIEGGFADRTNSVVEAVNNNNNNNHRTPLKRRSEDALPPLSSMTKETTRTTESLMTSLGKITCVHPNSSASSAAAAVRGLKTSLLNIGHDNTRLPTIKLGVIGKDATEYRRFNIDGTNTSEEHVKQLLLCAIQQYNHTLDTKPEEFELSQYRITLSYLDPEGDKTIIGSPREFESAIDLFRASGLITISAKVSPRSFFSDRVFHNNYVSSSNNNSNDNNKKLNWFSCLTSRCA